MFFKYQSQSQIIKSSRLPKKLTLKFHANPNHDNKKSPKICINQYTYGISMNKEKFEIYDLFGESLKQNAINHYKIPWFFKRFNFIKTFASSTIKDVHLD